MLVLYQTEGKTVGLPVGLCCELHLSAHELWEMTKRFILDWIYFCALRAYNVADTRIAAVDDIVAVTPQK